MGMVTTEYLDSKVATFAAAAGATGTDGPLKGAKMILFTNVLAPTKTTKVADLTQPAYPGYAAQVITWSAPTRDDDGGISLLTGLMTFAMTDATMPTTVTGYGITDGAGTNLLASEEFPAAVNLVDALSSLGIVAEYSPSSSTPGEAQLIT